MLSLTRCPFSLLDLPMRFTNDCRLNMRGGCKPMERVNTMAIPMMSAKRMWVAEGDWGSESNQAYTDGPHDSAHKVLYE